MWLYICICIHIYVLKIYQKDSSNEILLIIAHFIILLYIYIFIVLLYVYYAFYIFYYVYYVIKLIRYYLKNNYPIVYFAQNNHKLYITYLIKFAYGILFLLMSSTKN